MRTFPQMAVTIPISEDQSSGLYLPSLERKERRPMKSVLAFDAGEDVMAAAALLGEAVVTTLRGKCMTGTGSDQEVHSSPLPIVVDVGFGSR